jgi:hypothetical protein
MKHLKPFNEDIISFNRFLTKIDELQDIINSQLVNLYDEGFEVDYKVVSNKDSSALQIVLDKMSFGERYSFKWDEVKDSFIPLIKLLSRRYNFLNFIRGKQILLEVGHGNALSQVRGRESQYFTLEDIINDDFNIQGNKRIFMIIIKIGE